MEMRRVRNLMLEKSVKISRRKVLLWTPFIIECVVSILGDEL